MIRLHDLRHGWAMMALAAGTHLKVVQERLRNANISSTPDSRQIPAVTPSRSVRGRSAQLGGVTPVPERGDPGRHRPLLGKGVPGGPLVVGMVGAVTTLPRPVAA